MTALPDEQTGIKNWFNQTYQREGFGYLRPLAAYAIYAKLLALQPGEPFLDVACGPGLMLRQAALRLLRDHRPHRLFIEPTGLASPATVVDLFRSPGFAATTALGPVITLVDPAHWHSPRHREHDPWLDQIEVADVLLASRADLAPAEQTQTFLREAAALFPPKIHVGTVDHGALDLALLDLPARARPEPVHDLKIIGYRDDDQPGLILDRVAVAAARRPVAHADVVGQGWAFPPAQVFEFALLEDHVGGSGV